MALSYDPNRGANPKSSSALNSYKSTVQTGLRSAGVPTRGPRNPQAQNLGKKS